MLKGIPKLLSPELLKVLGEMGHNDILVLGDANFPGAGIAQKGGTRFIRADGIGAVALIDAILQMIPADTYGEKPIHLIEKPSQDKDLPTPIWDEFATVVSKYDKRGGKAIGTMDKFEFYDKSKEAFAIVQSGEEALYGCIMLRKGVIK